MNWLTKKLTNSLMNSALERALRKRAGAADNSCRAAFCGPWTQVAFISVDTAGMEVTSSGQKGIWVQWP
jgi:hypothetical protein